MARSSSNTRRNFLKQTGLGAAAAMAGFTGRGTASARQAALTQGPLHTSSKQLYEVDVLVVGAGPAGIGAALERPRAVPGRC